MGVTTFPKAALLDENDVDVVFSGYSYRRLDKAFLSPTNFVQQQRAMHVPSGWEIAPDDAVVVSNVIAKFGWSAAALGVCGGAMYHTLAWEPPGKSYQGKAWTTESLSTVEPESYLPSENVGILIRRKYKRKFEEQNSEHCKKLATALWVSKKHTDCTVVCDGQTWRVHRAVLANASPVLDRMLEGEMTEARSQTVNVNDTQPSMVEAMLKFLYTGQLSIPDGEVSSLLILANYYEVKSLVEACATQALECISKDTVVSIVRAFRILQHTGENCDEHHSWDALLSVCSQDKELLSIALAEL